MTFMAVLITIATLAVLASIACGAYQLSL